MADATPWLLVGLGNPGARYEKHRHNVGFDVVDAFVRRHDSMASWQDKWHATAASVSSRELGRIVVIKPQTYMNGSGKSVVAAAGFHKVPPRRIMVVHDEIDFEFARIQVKDGGGHGGHNGVRDIIQLLGAREFVRIRVGVGRPPGDRDPSGWVLSDFDPIELRQLPDVLERAVEAVTVVMSDGIKAAQNQFNETSRQSPTRSSSEPPARDDNND